MQKYDPHNRPLDIFYQAKVMNTITKTTPGVCVAYLSTCLPLVPVSLSVRVSFSLRSGEVRFSELRIPSVVVPWKYNNERGERGERRKRVRAGAACTRLKLRNEVK